VLLAFYIVWAYYVYHYDPWQLLVVVRGLADPRGHAGNR